MYKMNKTGHFYIQIAFQHARKQKNRLKGVEFIGFPANLHPFLQIGCSIQNKLSDYTSFALFRPVLTPNRGKMMYVSEKI